jgi:hypothetical protein
MSVHYKENSTNCSDLCTNETQMDVRDTKALEKRLDDLGNRLEKLSEYKELNERYSFFLKEISKVLTEQNKYYY